MSKEVSLFKPHEYTERTRSGTHFPMGILTDDVRRQETTDQDQREPIHQAGREGETQIDHTQSVQGVEEKTTEANKMSSIAESYEATGVPG